MTKTIKFVGFIVIVPLTTSARRIVQKLYLNLWLAVILFSSDATGYVLTKLNDYFQKIYVVICLALNTMHFLCNKPYYNHYLKVSVPELSVLCWVSSIH